MTRAANLAEAAGSGFAFRNRLINGAMDIWQRGTTFTAGGYGPDRWALQVAGTCTLTQESSDVPSGARYALKWTTGASSSYGQIRQFLEQLNVIPLRGQTVTASAMVKISSGFSGTLTFEIYYNPTSDSASAGGWVGCTYSVVGTPTSTGYTKITATFTVPSNAVGLYIGVVPTAAQSSGVTAYISQVQLEPGATATPFENRFYGTELMLCQRYYQTSNGVQTWAGWGDGTGGYRQIVIPIPQMRATPSVSYFDYVGNASKVTTRSNVGGATNNQAIGNIAGTYPSTIVFDSLGSVANNGYGFSWTASAEL
jgi:hypothetical protein